MIVPLIIFVLIDHVLTRDDVKHIGSHKFRFNDEILDLKQNVVNGQNRVKGQIKAKTNLDRTKEFFKQTSLLKAKHKKEINHTQSIGYTSDSYPNPVTNPQLCVHTFYTKTFLCDPDGLLSESEQEKINQSLANSKNKSFASLSHNIFVESGKDKEETQEAFGKDLLKKYSESVHSDERNSVLISYVKEFQTLKIIAGEELLDKKLKPVSPELVKIGKQEFLSKLEKDFKETQKETYQSLKRVIEELNSQLERSTRGYILIACLGVLVLLLIWGFYIYRQFNSGGNT